MRSNEEILEEIRDAFPAAFIFSGDFGSEHIEMGVADVAVHLSWMPGLCGTVVIHELGMAADKIDARLALAECTAKAMGFGNILCSHYRAIPKTVLEERGYKELHSYTNPRTDNRVTIFTKDLV